MMCIFCDIIARKLPASVVYEDTQTLAFMDLHQANPGHVLIIPRIHVEKITDCPLDIAAALLPVVVKVAQAVQQAFNPDGLSITQANGAAAMQEVPHIHIPRDTALFSRWCHPVLHERRTRYHTPALAGCVG